MDGLDDLIRLATSLSHLPHGPLLTMNKNAVHFVVQGENNLRVLKEKERMEKEGQNAGEYELS